MHLSPTQRLEIIAIFNDLCELSVNNKCKRVSELACGKGFQITPMRVRLIVKNMKFLVIFNFEQVYILLVQF